MSVTTLTVAGRKVTITEDNAPRQIWRGTQPDGSPKLAGEWPGRGWRFIVHGMMSGGALTRDGALARADYFARSGDRRAPRARFALSRVAAEALLDAEAADLAALLAAYPFEAEDVEKLTRIGFLDADGKVKKDRDAERAILMGVVPSPF